jgi:hypothetical protein
MEHSALKEAIARRREEALKINTDIDIACDKAANRGCPRDQASADRSEWTHAAWNRYVAAAVEMDRLYSARLSRLYRDIEALERLSALPLAARAS